MELPENLKSLYKHWDQHTQYENTASAKVMFQDATLFKDMERFIHERISVWEKKTKGEKPPYTKDEILCTYRFCNIFREFDRQTIEFHAMLNPFRDNFALWLMNMFYMRLVARTETIECIGLLSFNKEENTVFYEKLMNSTRPRYGTPYVFPVSTIQRTDTPTREMFISFYLPSVMETIAAEIQTWKKLSVSEGIQNVIPLFGFNHTFLWTEVLIDVAYQYPEYIDLFKLFPIGPGSAPTMKRIDGLKDPSVLVQELAAHSFDTGITYEGTPLRLSAENWEGIGCEYRKYTNLKMGKGRRRLFRKGE